MSAAGEAKPSRGRLRALLERDARAPGHGRRDNEGNPKGPASRASAEADTLHSQHATGHKKAEG